MCGATAEGELCFKHERSLLELKKKYASWKAAFGLSPQEYLVEVSKRKETGEWTKGLIKYILENKRFDLLI